MKITRGILWAGLFSVFLAFAPLGALAQDAEPEAADAVEAQAEPEAADAVEAQAEPAGFAGMSTRSILLVLGNALGTTGLVQVYDKLSKKKQRRKDRKGKLKRFFGSMATSILLPAAGAFFGGIPIGDAIKVAAVGWLGSQGLNNTRRSLRAGRDARTRGTD